MCASPTHTRTNPGSDHEPHVTINGKSYATAVDLTDDKVRGCDADAWAEYLRLSHDERVKYVICNRRMFSSYPARGYPAWTWRPYTGSNPHESHTHLSIVPEAVFDIGPWFPQLLDPAPPEDVLVRDERIIVVPALKDGRQLVGKDKEGKALGRWSATSSAQVCASTKGDITRLMVQPTRFGDELVLAVALLDGSPAPEGAEARVLIERR